MGLPAGVPPALRDRLRSRSHPAWSAPMLATLTHDYFSDRDWIFERKLDGERVIASRSGGRVRLLSRNRKQLNDTYPEIVEALERQKADDFFADGEVVAFDGQLTSFSRLQGRMQVRDPDEARRTGIDVYYYLFDLTYLDGYDLTGLPLRIRKQLLRRLLTYRDPLRFTSHRNEKGEQFLEEACRQGWEGLIAKRADSRYRHSRSTDWLKFKCSNEQEFVIGGYTDPKGSRRGFGALLVGYYENGDLQYAGKVGTGFDEAMLRDLGRRLQSIERDTSPFANHRNGRGTHWVDPRLVGEVGFTEWTRDGRLRHPRFLGLRRDRPPRSVVRERPR